MEALAGIDRLLESMTLLVWREGGGAVPTTLPDPMRDAAERLQFGELQRRYRFRPLVPVLLLPLPLIVTVISLFAGGIPTSIVFGSITALLVVWAVLIRRNRSVYVFDNGLVLVDMLARVRRAWRWPEVDRVHGLTVRIQPTGSVRRQEFTFSHVEPGVSFGVTTLEMSGVVDLAGLVAQRVHDARVVRLTAGETVGFGVFEISPTALRHIPADLIDRPSVPVTVPLSQVTQVGMEDRNIVVGLADGRRLSEHVAAVSDPDLFVATLVAVIKGSRDRG